MFILSVQDPQITQRIGFLATRWPHVEEAIIELLGSLIGDNVGDKAHTIFRAIVNQQTRIAVMRELLEKSFWNLTESHLFNELLDEFSDLNTIRNTYLHSKWSTHEDGRTFISDAAGHHLSHRAGRRVTVKELDQVIERMESLIRRIYIDLRAELRRQQQAWQETRAQWHEAHVTPVRPAPRNSDEEP